MDTRQRLLDSAENLVRARGYDAFSYADLSAQVGIRKASIHHHFPRKSDLAEALIERYADRFAEVLDAIAERASTGGALLEGYLKAYRAALQGGEAMCLCVAFSAGRDSLTDPVLQQLNGFHENGRSWLRATFAAGALDGTILAVGEPADEGAATLALVEGAQLIARAAADPAAFDACVRGLTLRIKT